MEELYKEHNDKNTKDFNFNDYVNYCRVINILDGDTIKVIINVFGNFYKITLRLNGIDCCETKSKNQDNKDLGIKAKLRLFNIITNKEITNDKKEIKKELNNNTYLIWGKFLDFDKYGRVLADIYKNKDDTLSISEILINEKLAYYYDGKTKLTEKEQIDILD